MNLDAAAERCVLCERTAVILRVSHTNRGDIYFQAEKCSFTKAHVMLRMLTVCEKAFSGDSQDPPRLEPATSLSLLGFCSRSTFQLFFPRKLGQQHLLKPCHAEGAKQQAEKHTLFGHW